MSAFQPQIILLPGMGADERLFAAQREAFPNLVTPRWITPRPGEGLAEYAERLAAELPIGRPLLLGGCSLGGMIAYEMAHPLRPDALVLIASAATREAIPRLLRALAKISRIVPAIGYRFGKLFSPLIEPILGGRKIEHRRLLAAMLRDTPPEFLRWSCIAVGGWRPRPLTGVQIFTIHGDNDRVLPLGKRRVDFIVPGGGHFLPATHGEEVNAALRHVVANMISESPSPQNAGRDDATSK